MRNSGVSLILAVAFALVIGLPRARTAQAHCETEVGAMVAAGLDALAAGDLERVRPWVEAGQAGELRAAFARALELRALDPQTRQQAEVDFLLTLVRLHRAGHAPPPARSLAPAAQVQGAVLTVVVGWLHALERMSQ